MGLMYWAAPKRLWETYSRLHQTDFRLSNGLRRSLPPSVGARIVMLRTHKATHRGCAICSERLQECIANSSSRFAAQREYCCFLTGNACLTVSTYHPQTLVGI